MESRFVRVCQFGALLLALASVLPGQSPYTPNELRPFENAVLDLARVGKSSEAAVLAEQLTGFGFPADRMERLQGRLERVRPRPERAARSLPRTVKALRKTCESLAGKLAAVDDPVQQVALARSILRIDGDVAAAREVLGDSFDGVRWRTAVEMELLERRSQIQDMIRQARALEVEFEVEPSDHELLLHVRGRSGHVVTARGVRMHSDWPVEKAKRILGNALRGIAMSRWLVDGGELRLPRALNQTYVCFLSNVDYEKALAYDRAANKITPDDRDQAHRFACYTRRDQTEVNFDYTEMAAIGGLYSLISTFNGGQMHGRSEFPAILAGHANWVLMAMFGSSVPGVAFSGPELRSTVSDDQRERDLLVGAGLMGARAWLRHEVENGRGPAWSASFEDQVGKIDGVDLLKCTFVVEYLQLLGDLGEWLKPLRSTAGKSQGEVLDRVAGVLGEDLSAFERRWSGWFLGNSTGGPSLVEQLGGGAAGAANESDPDLVAALRILKELRGPALSRAYLADVPDVKSDAELSMSCKLHAGYLQQHPEQAAAWPDAHEEYTDREGFTPEGAWAGGHSVIAPGTDGPKDAIDAWMATYYHRLPLIDPGLLMIGWGQEGDCCVLDSGSVVREIQTGWSVTWPYSGQQGVPLRFRPELPNPFPGEDQSSWGYPITVQLGPRVESQTPELEIELRQGGAGGELVDCLVSSPQQPGNPLLVPVRAWCLIPKRPLKSGTSYFVSARFVDGSEPALQWSFRTGR